MLEAIYASRLYKSSKCKDKIRSAMENPINSELVQQLRTYLDEDYQGTDRLELLDDTAPNKSPDTAPPAASEPSAAPKFSPYRNTSDTSDTSLVDDMEDLDRQLSDDFESNDAIDDSHDEPGDVSESTHVSGASVTASTDCSYNPVMVEVVKGTLNSRSDTCGVNRVIQKDNELWVYYDDKTNLNNVMGPAIETLANSGCQFLEFNRLARSDNAIVFEVQLNSTSTFSASQSGSVSDASKN